MTIHEHVATFAGMPVHEYAADQGTQAPPPERSAD